jgi:ferredoxin
MAQSILIIYFSGTGNTAAVCRHIKTVFERTNATGQANDKCEQYTVTLMRAEDYLACNENQNLTFDQLGIAYPVHAFSSPPIIEQVIRLLPNGCDREAFLLYTAGDFVRINQMAGRKVIALLRKQRYKVNYERLIVMGSNWLIGYDDAFNSRLYQAAQIKAAHMVTQLKQKREHRYHFVPVMHHGGWLFYYMEKFGAKLFGRLLHTTDACTRCGKCLNACPVGNIQRKNGQIQFHGKCQMCMRCVYQCPVNAIRSHGLQWMILKEGYSIEKIIKGACGKIDGSANDKTSNGNKDDNKAEDQTALKGYSRHFIAYFDDIER